MKNLICVVLLFAGITASAQICGEKGIATDPLNSYPNGRPTPYNPEKPAAANHFNWRLNPLVDGVNFMFTPVTGTPVPLLSPWHIANDPSVQYNAMAKGINSDYKPADGWEVFKVNLGRLADNTTYRMRVPVVPYIMLYNKYTGVLRIFAHLDRTGDYNSINVKLSVEDPATNSNTNYSAILGVGGETHQALDQTTSITSLSAVSTAPNNKTMFFWADFPLAYDGCVCNFASRMKVEFSAITNGEIKLKGNILGSVVPAVSQPSNPVFSIKNAVGAISSIGKAVMTASVLDITDAIKNVLGLTNIAPELKQALDIFNDMVKAGNTLDQLPSANKGKVSEAFVAVFNRISALSKSGNTSASILVATTELQGTLTNAFDFQNSRISFSTPGSQGSNDNPEENINNEQDPYGNVRPEYVTYNEILGAFALLKTPVVQVSYNSVGNPPPGTYSEFGYIDHQQVRFAINPTVPLIPGSTSPARRDNALKYVLNPILHTNWANTKIKVAMVARTKMGFQDQKAPRITGLSSNYPMKNLSVISKFYPNMLEKWNCIYYPGTNDVEACFPANSSNEFHTSNFDVYELISPLVPVEFLYDLKGEFTLYGTNGFETDSYNGVGTFQRLEDVRLKFFVDFESTDIGSDGKPVKSVMVFTYPLEIMVENSLPEPTPINLNQTRTPIPPVAATELQSFCTGMDYRARYKTVGLTTSKTLVQSTVFNARVADAEKVEMASKKTKNAAINVFPNPARDKVNIDFELTSSSDVIIQILDMNSQEIKSVTFKNRPKGKYREQINIGNPAPGTYVLKINANNKIASAKFIVVP